MSRTCDLCGKHTAFGNKVSHAKNRTRRTWKPNLKKVKTQIEGSTFTVKLCTRCLRSDLITKKVRIPGSRAQYTAKSQASQGNP